MDSEYPLLIKQILTKSKDDDFSSNNLLDIICPRIVKGVSLLKEWVQNQ